MVDTVTRELLRGRGAENEVALEARVDDLHNHLLVGEADDQAVLRGVVLVLRLGDQPLAGVVCADVNTDFALQSEGLYSQSVLPSLRRRYLTWKREKYASDLTFLTKGI